MIACLLAASSAEAGETGKAVRMHGAFAISFAAIILLGCVVFIVMGDRLLEAYYPFAEVVAIASAYLRLSAVIVLGASLLLFAVGQAVLTKYSLLLTFIIGWLCLLAGYVSLYLAGNGIGSAGTAIGLRFVGCFVVPFALIPVKAFSASFGQGEGSKAAESSAPIKDAPKSYPEQYREKH